MHRREHDHWRAMHRPLAAVGSAVGEGAGLLVMGYCHSRTRERVFGGFTRELLTSCELPLFMLH